MEKKNIIWSNYDVYDVEEQDLIGDDLYILQRINNTAADVVALADVGRWNGRLFGYKVMDNVQECFNVAQDYAEFYVDPRNNFRCRTSHHDGTNYILFREWKPDVSDVQRENFLQKWCSGTWTSRDLCRYTKSIGRMINTF